MRVRISILVTQIALAAIAIFAVMNNLVEIATACVTGMSAIAHKLVESEEKTCATPQS